MITGTGAHHESNKYLFGTLQKASFRNRTFSPLVVKDVTLPTPPDLLSTSTRNNSGFFVNADTRGLTSSVSAPIEGVLLSKDVEKNDAIRKPSIQTVNATREHIGVATDDLKNLVTSTVTYPDISEHYHVQQNVSLNPASPVTAHSILTVGRDTDAFTMTRDTGNASMAGNIHNTSAENHVVFGNKFPTRLLEIFKRNKAICREKLKSTPPLETDGPYCNRTIDLFGGCWPDTAAGDIAITNCPDMPGYNDKALMTRNCTIDGTWYVHHRTKKAIADYSHCQLPDDAFAEDTKYIYIFIGGFLLSLLMLLVSLGIFFRFRQLRCDRITIHKNLFISYICTGISWIFYYVFAALDGDVLLANPVWCQSLHIVCQYFTVCNFMWMFCEGLYLNTIMVYAFSSGKTLIVCCYLVGWGLPVILTVVYTAVRSSVHIAAMDCWIGESVLQWIMYGPIVLSLVINIIFLINIVRLLITKLRQMPEVAQTRKAVRATLILVPLFGLQYLLFPIQPQPGSELLRKAVRATLILVPLLGLQYLLFPIRPQPGSELEEFYHTVVALLISLQGAFVSVMYCFCNGEVISVVRRKWNQHKLMSKSSIRNTSVHGGTTYTTVDHDHTQANATLYYSTADNKEPPLEMSKIDKEGHEP